MSGQSLLLQPDDNWNLTLIKLHRTATQMTTIFISPWSMIMPARAQLQVQLRNLVLRGTHQINTAGQAIQPIDQLANGRPFERCAVLRDDH